MVRIKCDDRNRQRGVDCNDNPLWVEWNLEKHIMVTGISSEYRVAVWVVGSCVAMVASMATAGELDQQLRLQQPTLLHALPVGDAALSTPQINRADLRATGDGVIAGVISGGSDTCSLAVVTSLPVGPAGMPSLVTIAGDNSTVTNNDCASFGNTWWEAFQITECATVTLDFCGTTPQRTPDYTGLATDCGCTEVVFPAAANRADCGDNNLTVRYEGLAPGTYYYPVFSNAGSAIGAYTMHLSAETSALCMGACCDQTNGICSDNIDVAACAGPNQTYLNQGACCEMDCLPTGTEFDALNVSLLSRVPLADFTTAPTEANEAWGYVSPSSREYAIIGLECAVAFVEVTDPINPVIVAEIPGPCSIWRDMAIFQERAYNVIESTGNGLQIMDLSSIDSGIVTLEATTFPGGLTTAHNITVNEDTGFAYAVGADTNPGIVALDLSTPANPPVAGNWSDATVHDVLVVSYTSGPYAGREIAFASSSSSGLKIVDVTDKANMITRSTVLYPNTSITHAAWLSEDRRFLFLGDEGD